MPQSGDLTRAFKNTFLVRSWGTVERDRESLFFAVECLSWWGMNSCPSGTTSMVEKTQELTEMFLVPNSIKELYNNSRIRKDSDHAHFIKDMIHYICQTKH